MRRPGFREQHGQVLVLSGAALLVFLFLGTLVVDAGNWMVHRRHLQTQADAAALATSDAFTNCLLNPGAANAAVEASALRYAGDVNRDPATLNRQVTPDKSVHVVLNSTQYWPAGADHDGGPPSFCSRRYVDVKATDDDVPGLLGLIPFLPDIHAHARAEIRLVRSLTGLMPWGVPETEPSRVWALFVDEGNPGGALPLALPLNKQSVQLVNGSNYQLYGAATAGVTIPPRTSVVIMTSKSASATAPVGPIATICAQPTVIACIPGSGATDGLGFVRHLVPPISPSEADPALTSLDFGAGNCTSDTSAGYYLYNANCSPLVTATIDFGPGYPDPTVSPLFARAYLVGPDCPTSPDPGCPMSYRLSDGKWVAAVPIFAGSGQRPFSIEWRTGGPGPGATVLAAFTFQPEMATRTLAAATRAAADCGSGSSITVVKTLNNNNVALGARTNSGFSFDVNRGSTTCDPSPVAFASSGSNTFVVDTAGNLRYQVTEVGTPIAGYTTAYSAGNKTNCADMSKTDTCTITNTAVVGTLNVTKVVINDNAGTKTPADFQFRVADSSAPTPRQTAPIAFPAAASTSTTSVSLFRSAAGPAFIYNVTELTDPGYTTTYSSGCSNITITATPVTCTITNNDNVPSTGTLVVRKVLTNDNGGTKAFTDFSFSVNGGVAQPFNAVGQVTLAVAPGQYTVTETPDSGYTTTRANCTAVTVTLGGVTTCTITNNDKPGSLTIVKQVVGGAASPGDWTMTVSGPSIVTPFPGSAAGNTLTPVNAGAYAISETGGPAGYGLSFPAGTTPAQDCSPSGTVTVPNGGSRTCVLVNTQGAATLPPRSGQWANVARPYAADGASAPVGYLRITTDGLTPAHFFTSGTQNFNVSVGLAGSLKGSAALDPPYLLRWNSTPTSSSRTQLADCDKGRQPEDEIRDGCFTWYQTSATNSCVPLYVSASSLPPSTYTPNPIPDCISVKTGGNASLAKGVSDRFESPCTDNNWPKAPTDPPPSFDDPRWVNLVVTGEGSFESEGTGNVAIIRFAGFYVTGWNTSGPQLDGCDSLPADKRNEAFPGSGAGDLWGHFSSYSIPAANADPSDTLCPITEPGVCTLVLTQ